MVRLLVEAQGGETRAKYGDSLIKEYSKRLSLELGMGYGERSLKNMRKFYIYAQKGQTLSAQLSWSHYCELLPYENINKVKYYIKISEEQNLSVRELRNKKNREYKEYAVKTLMN